MPVRAVDANAVAVVDALVASWVPTTAGMPNSRLSDGRVRGQPAGIGDEAGDLGEQHDPRRVGHVADEDVAGANVVELVLAQHDARHALDDRPATRRCP